MPTYNHHHAYVKTSEANPPPGLWASFLNFLLRLLGGERSTRGQLTLYINSPLANATNVPRNPVTGSGTISDNTATLTATLNGGGQTFTGVFRALTGSSPTWTWTVDFTNANIAAHTTYVMNVQAVSGTTGVGAAVQFTTGN